MLHIRIKGEIMKELYNKCMQLYKKNKEIINYLIFGVLTTIVSFASYFIFAKLCGIDEIISNMLSWVISVAFAFVTNKIWVFESKTNTVGSFFKEMFKFYLSRVLSGVICDICTFSLMVKVLHINDMISKLVIQVMVTILNYLFSKLIVFKSKKEKVVEK